MKTLIIEKNESTKETVKLINSFRLENKNNWYQINIINLGIKLKCFNTWIQISTKPIFSNAMDMSIKDFKNNLELGINKIS